ncbi:hypothetical protein PCC7424_0137 [Gloeothece citriformis PCC 7424]|uniref:Uncharacterized protein n=1 Tax=Gloeothece citriformis (strain PCC 7424) TaxID=65393 RepID=B7K9C4_GLOC7|nr:hypothetical protein [Gloeothece citriformis]ACK68607.1 hypothetical protein PCC7424_0137 [Gloeothece citriformis PCC 7424]
MLRIIKESKAKFLVYDKTYPNSQIHLNFLPFIEKENLKSGLLLHLRARPPINPNAWTYGVYDVENDQYYSTPEIEIDKVLGFSINIPELQSKPTHLLCYLNAIFKTGEGVGYIFQENDLISSPSTKKTKTKA